MKGAKSPFWSINKIVALITVLGLIWVIVYRFWLINIPPMFSKAFEAGDLFYQLANATIASGVFFFLVVYIEQRRIKNLISPIIKNRLINFAISESLIRRILFRALNGDVENFYCTIEEMKKGFDKIKLTDQPPNHPETPQFKDWYELFDFFFIKDQARIKGLYELVQYLDPVIISKLEEINYSSFELSLDAIGRGDYPDYRVSGVDGPLEMYLKSCHSIALLSDTHV